MGTFGVIGGGSGRYSGSAGLFGVVEAVVVLVRTRMGRLAGEAGEDTAPQDGEYGADPSRVQGEPKRHETLIPLVRSNGEPDCGHHPTQTNYKHDHSSDDRHLVLALRFAAETDAGHGHEEHGHSGETQDGPGNHQGTGRLDISWQFQYLRICNAVVKSRGDNAVCPRAPDAQLVHLLAGVQTVFTHDHPVVRSCGNHYTQPAQTTEEEAGELKTGVGHNDTKK